MRNIKWLGWSVRVALAFFAALATAHQMGAAGMALWLPAVVAGLTTAEAGLANLNQAGE